MTVVDINLNCFSGATKVVTTFVGAYVGPHFLGTVTTDVYDYTTTLTGICFDEPGWTLIDSYSDTNISVTVTCVVDGSNLLMTTASSVAALTYNNAYWIARYAESVAVNCGNPVGCINTAPLAYQKTVCQTTVSASCYTWAIDYQYCFSFWDYTDSGLPDTGCDPSTVCTVGNVGWQHKTITATIA
jgi:hypothetical protein